MGDPGDMRALVGRFYAVLWNEGDLSAAPDILTEDLYFRGSLGAEKHGVEGFCDYMRAVTAALAEFHCEIDALVVEGAAAFAKMRFRGNHIGDFQGFSPTGKLIEYAGAAHFEARGGKLCSIWVLGDLDDLRAQLKANAG